MVFLPVTYPGRDSLAFALPIDAAELESVTLRAVDGTVIAQPDPAGAVGGSPPSIRHRRTGGRP
jgi:hypothetical protein